MMSEQNLTLHTHDGYVLAQFHHDLDMEVMLSLKPEIDRLLPQIRLPLLIDLEHVHFLDSSAIGLLAMFFRHAQAHHLPIMIVAAQPQPEAVLGMVGLSDHVPLYGSLSEAETALTVRLKG